MRFYTGQHQYYCGIDLHARSMYLCILNQAGEVQLHRDMPAGPEAFLRAIEPYRASLAVAVECIFTWYWLADLCVREKIAFVLGHALYKKAIHGGKAKNDKIDAHKIAVLLRGGAFPTAYVYPRGMRATRDLLRRRLFFVRRRSELFTHIRITFHQINHNTCKTLDVFARDINRHPSGVPSDTRKIEEHHVMLSRLEQETTCIERRQANAETMKEVQHLETLSNRPYTATNIGSQAITFNDHAHRHNVLQLLNISKGDIKPEKGGDIGVGFSSIFWNTSWTRGQKPHTLGILCNPSHPALSEFPTEYHSDWQWWGITVSLVALFLIRDAVRQRVLRRIRDAIRP